MPRKPLCPAASPLAGPPLTGPSVICGVLARDRDLESQQHDRGPESHVVFSSTEDPMTYHGACCSPYYWDCVIFKAEKHRIWEQRESLSEPDRRKQTELLPGDPGYEEAVS